MYGNSVSDPPSTPTILINGQPMNGAIKVVNNTDVPVVCSCDSKPPPSYRWLYKSNELSGNVFVQRIKENVTLTCIATNTMAVSTGVMNSNITGNSTTGISFHILCK